MYEEDGHDVHPWRMLWVAQFTFTERTETATTKTISSSLKANITMKGFEFDVIISLYLNSYNKLNSKLTN